MIDIPVSLSPLSMVWTIGDAPRHRGKILGWTLRIPLQQQSALNTQAQLQQQNQLLVTGLALFSTSFLLDDTISLYKHRAHRTLSCCLAQNRMRPHNHTTWPTFI